MKLLSVGAIIAILILSIACSGGPATVKPGTPAFFWAVANESYRNEDMLKAESTLLELGKGEHEYAARARTWHLVVAAGVAGGLRELAEAYETGSRSAPTGSARLRNEMNGARRNAATAALEFAQAVKALTATNKDASIHCAFPFPAGNMALPADLEKISRGIWPADEERQTLQREMLRRGVLKAVAAAAGSPEDSAKAQAVFQAQEVQIPRETFLYQMAKLLYEQSDLFAEKQLDRPELMIAMCDGALQTLQTLPENKDTKALAAKLQDMLKKVSKGRPSPRT